MSIRTAIIDRDECHVHELENLVRLYAPECCLCGTANDPEGAVHLLEREHPQLVFIDVRLGEATAFDLLDSINYRDFELIFVTDSERHAVQAFQRGAIHYLLKPLDLEELETAILRARKKLRGRGDRFDVDALLSNIAQHQGDQSRKISIPTLGGFDFIDLQEILWCKSEGMYTVFHMLNGTKVLSSRNIGAYEELLCTNDFFRIHHSVIINMRCIKRYKKGKGGFVVLCDGTELEVSQRKKGEFLEKFVI